MITTIYHSVSNGSNSSIILLAMVVMIMVMDKRTEDNKPLQLLNMYLHQSSLVMSYMSYSYMNAHKFTLLNAWIIPSDEHEVDTALG